MSVPRRAIRVAMGCLTAITLTAATGLHAQSGAPKQTPTKPATPNASATPTPVPTGVTPPPGYVIGADDQLTVNFWRDKDMSADVVVRPDGKITLPLIDEVQAAGLTPAELTASVTKASMKFLTVEPTVSVIVRQINSRKVYITGQVAKTGPFPLQPGMTIVMLISMAGGLQEYADKEHIQVVRIENGQQKSYWFNYKDFSKGKPAALKQNIELRIGDTVIVP